MLFVVEQIDRSNGARLHESLADSRPINYERNHLAEDRLRSYGSWCEPPNQGARQTSPGGYTISVAPV